MDKKLYIITYDDHRHISGVAGRSRMIINWTKNMYNGFIEIPLEKIEKEITYPKIKNVRIIEPLNIVSFFKKILKKDNKVIKISKSRSNKKVNILKKIYRSIFKYKVKRIVGKNNTIIVLGFQRLIHLNLETLKNNKVILSQSNSPEKSFEALLKTDYEKFKVLKKIVVYTKNDLLEIKKKLLKMNVEIDDSKFEVIPNPSKIRREKLSKYGRKIVFLARLYDEQKNLKVLIEVMKKLPEFDLYVYGEGPDKEMLKDIKNIKLMGKTSNVKEAYTEKAIFLMTSHYEGFGNTNVEAMSCGLPVIAFNTYPAISSIVDNNKNGFILEANNIQDFIEKIKFLLLDEIKYEKFSLAALEKSKIYQEKIVKEKWLRILKEIK